MVYLAIFIGGAFGGGLRYLTSVMIHNTTFPLSTIIINVLGALLMGVMTSYFISYFKTHPNIKKMITTGFIGAFTTYSSLSLETVVLLKNGHIIIASLYLILSMIFGFIFIAIGYKKGTIHS
ncbi:MULTISPECIES: fluoride efflux transporter CrcB [Mammaliicoccus]|uniref:Fluoride-specific ion channel FluC n=1 Tax=Mammaliicoccus vitulinus TaxID=71237 RepID=A0A2T4PSL4_9STAP|nr:MULTISPECIES: fluoride efflux transporter CrcB [Mammaliicoccus]HAL08419.1 fluoride efflux transporter CrcB [Staphylococcus sp.]MBM6628438.1 fluoride efflux transporter CrcB [Mammaliicoccus vitulinus]MEB7658065.1 fluoride efflux transporter CrcB [Mammaliicoccus vitulinus]PTI29311.1 fluoride efflux transporter CrcB [Mammaliicoccus vitulinus]PTI73063.1 fluoride efflux transporter CrcB [Mammaliicoccus vitulinus]